MLLPIFSEVRGEGRSREYRIFGYAAFKLTGYRFSGASYQAPCSGSSRCISGSFVRFVDLTENFDYSPDGPRLGASVVALTPSASE
ncbi:hypothetical protein [Nesterenkonia pannonica]|uniref:hypothetical protein n=1 Tax=Nesterenkonia pannonica TaxID=1548602 RepID=UPI0021644548|nr:hypothetical protein [Nesterenkonia pannonica]